jgi:hypothetical protein
MFSEVAASGGRGMIDGFSRQVTVMVSKYTLGLLAVLAALTLTSAAPNSAEGALRRAARLDACGDACCDPCINYRDISCVAPCKRTVKTSLCVTDPCTCCKIDVPVCLPCCCEGEPTVCCRNGLFGRHIVRYDWCCGCSVQVTILRCGDVLVTYL